LFILDIKKMKTILVVSLTLLLLSCDKDSRVLRNLENGKWNITSYKKTKYLGGNIDNESTGQNIGNFEFEKDGKCSMVLSATLNSSSQAYAAEVVSINLNNGKYDVYGSNDDDFDAKMNIDFDPRNYFSYSINQESKNKMKLTDRNNMQSFYGDGYVIEMTIEKE